MGDTSPYILPSRSWSELSATSFTVRTPIPSSMTDMKVKEWLTYSASPIHIPVSQSDKFKTDRKEDEGGKYSRVHEAEVQTMNLVQPPSAERLAFIRPGIVVQDLQEDQEVPSYNWADSCDRNRADEGKSNTGDSETSDHQTNRSQLSFKDLVTKSKATQIGAATKTQRLTDPSLRRVQNLRDSFMGATRMNEEAREDFCEMAREWGYHDPEIRKRIEQVLEEQEATDALEGKEVIFGDFVARKQDREQVSAERGLTAKISG